MKTIICALSLTALAIVACKGTKDKAIQEVVVNPANEYQIIEGFGASDCWSAQFVGKNWPLAKRDFIADLLFSKDFDQNGNPKGIGLSQWRFNIGGGSAEQGKESGIPDAWRRAECFINEKGEYDWSKQQGQQWFLTAAKQRGVEKLLAFNNTAPVYFTKNGKGWSPGGTAYNIQPEKMESYASFLAEVCKHFNQEGITFDYLSPFNEPQWNWSSPASQEGSPAHNNEIAQLARLLSPKMMEASPRTELMMTEAAQLQFLYKKFGYENRDNQLTEFYSPSSDNYIGNLPNVKKTLGGHSYFTTNQLDTLLNVRKSLRDSIAAHQNVVNFWQSEFCILESHPDIEGGNKRDLGMATALYVARVIHFDLALANAASWSWWTSMSVCDYKDGLIYFDNGNNGLTGANDPNSEALQKNGFVRESKLLWAMGNYSRFIRPGMKRIETRLSNELPDNQQANDLMISGYKSADGLTMVFVAVNYSSNEKVLSFSSLCDEHPVKGHSFVSYTTSATQNLERGITPVNKVVIHPKSVVTLVALPEL
jgi:hypothetical protein